MDYSQFLYMREELSLIAVLLLLFLADLFMSPDAHKNDGKPVLNTMLPVVLLTIHTLITIVPGPVADAFGGMYHNQPIQSIVKSILSIGTLIVFLMAHEWMRRPDTAIKQGEFYILTLSTLLGMYFMISAGHFLMFFIGLETASIPMAALVAFDKYRHPLCRSRRQVHPYRTLLQRTAALRHFADIRYGRHALLCRYPGTSGRKPVADYGIRILLLRHGIQDFAGAFPPVDGRRIRRRSEYGNRLPERYLQRCGGIRADDHPL